MTQIQSVETWWDGLTLYKKLQETKTDKKKAEKIMSIILIFPVISSYYSSLQIAMKPTMKGFHSSTIAISDWKLML
jgi:hypothetical protein